MKNILYLLALLLLVTTSCQQKKIYQDRHQFNNYTWQRFDKITFNIPIEKSSTTADIVLTVRHITQYPYPNLPMYIIMHTPSGEERILEKDIQLIDTTGNFKGDVAGDLWDVEEALWPNFYFTEAGTSTLEFENLIPIGGFSLLTISQIQQTRAWPT